LLLAFLLPPPSRPLAKGTLQSKICKPYLWDDANRSNPG